MGDLIRHPQHQSVEQSASPAERPLVEPLKKFETQISRLMQRLIEAETPAELTSPAFVGELIQIGIAAKVLRVLAEEARLGLRAQNRCAVIRLTAERRIWQIVTEMDRATVGHPKGVLEPHKSKPPTLPELGIDKNLAKRARRLAAIPQWEFDGLLRRATDRGWEITSKWLLTTSESRVRRQRNQEEQVGGRIEDLHEFIAAHPEGMGTIYMDPAWEIEGVSLPYPIMSVEEIKALPIPDLAAPRCHLHVWTLPGRTQRLAYEVIEHWGFRVVSEFCWKKGHGVGNGIYYRIVHENCLVAVWADRNDWFDDRGLPSCDEFLRGRHSEKPEEVRRRIELASPGPRIELFARRQAPGWYNWGYEIPVPLDQQDPELAPTPIHAFEETDADLRFAFDSENYILTPPDHYEKLDAEFHFDYDPCPYPRPAGYNSLNIPWGQSNYVNPPFRRQHGGDGPTAFVRKAIQEHKLGKTVVLMLPTQSYVNMLLEAGAELRPAGRIRWLDAHTLEPCRSPSPITCVVLRGKQMG